jgi:hypothetical protein
VDKFIKTLAKLTSRPVFFTRQERKQLAKIIERVNERQIPRQTGEWVCIFTRQFLILLAFGELVSGFPHP